MRYLLIGNILSNYPRPKASEDGEEDGEVAHGNVSSFNGRM